LRRKVATRFIRKTLLVFCEGERTEPEYLNALKLEPDVREAAAVDIQVAQADSGAVPLTLVKRAIEARRRAVSENDEVDEFWCVFDVEWPVNHANLPEALALAEANEISLAVSNPCFEVWLILHLKEHGAWLDNEQAAKLRRQLDSSTDKGLDPAKYMPNVREASARSARLEERHRRDGTSFPHDNPSSGMHHLIASVRVPAKGLQSPRLLEQLRVMRAALDRDRGGVALAGDRLDDLDPDPFEAEVRDESLGDALGGRLDQLESALDDDALDRVRDGRVVEGVPEVVTARGLGHVARHVHREGERLLDLALPVIYPDDRGDLQVPDRHDVSHLLMLRKESLGTPSARPVTLSH